MKFDTLAWSCSFRHNLRRLVHSKQAMQLKPFKHAIAFVYVKPRNGMIINGENDKLTANFHCREFN